MECIPLCYIPVLNVTFLYLMLKMGVSEGINEKRFEIKAGDG